MSLQTFKSTSHWILGIRTEITDCRNQSWLWGKWDVEIGSTIWLKLNTFPRRLPHFPPTPSVTFKERQQWRIFSHVLFTRRGVCLPFFFGSFPRFGFWLLLSTISRSRDFRLSLALRPQSEVFTVYTRFRLNLHFNLFARCLCFPLCLPAPFPFSPSQLTIAQFIRFHLTFLALCLKLALEAQSDHAPQWHFRHCAR